MVLKQPLQHGRQSLTDWLAYRFRPDLNRTSTVLYLFTALGWGMVVDNDAITSVVGSPHMFMNISMLLATFKEARRLDLSKIGLFR
jgi:hypothetical protein